MKKLTKGKLQLHRDTLRRLQPATFKEVNGGFIPIVSGEETCGTTTISCFQRCTG